MSLTLRRGDPVSQMQMQRKFYLFMYLFKFFYLFIYYIRFVGFDFALLLWDPL